MIERKLSSVSIGAANELLATVWLLKQGYEVLRNISPHGLVDIVAIKNGCVTLFDVKARYVRATGEKVHQTRLSPEQLALGVRGLAVFPDGSCVIDHTPASSAETMRGCATCRKEFMPSRGGTQKYCSFECRPSGADILARKAAKASARILRAQLAKSDPTKGILRPMEKRSWVRAKPSKSLESAPT